MSRTGQIVWFFITVLILAAALSCMALSFGHPTAPPSSSSTERDLMTIELRNTPVQTRSVTRLEQIKAAAVALYNNPLIGRDRLTTADVATLAGCSIGTIYRYFPDRVALLDEIAPDRDQSPVTA